MSDGQDQIARTQLASTASHDIPLGEHHRDLLRMTMPEALGYAAEQWGNRPALVHIEGGGPSLTWRELRHQVSLLRSGLQRAGVTPGDALGLLLRNQVEFPLTWLAAAELGAVIVPLNPQYRVRELEFVLDDTGASWLVADADIVSAYLKNADGSRRYVGPIPPERVIAAGGQAAGALSFADLVEGPATAASHSAASDDVVNIQFTSGTTGLPKGCLLTHRYWMELGVYSSALFGDPQRILADHPFYYMQNQAYLAMAMAGGGALYVTQGLSRRKLLGWLIDNRIDFAWIDAGMLDHPPSPRDKQLALKRVPVDGLPHHLHQGLESRFDLQAREWYASTEVGPGTFAPFERTDLVGSGSMGFCFPTRESKVIAADLRELPAGESGELCFRGSGMMLGYHNRPETNAELFLPGGWFRTGDIVRKTADGLHFYEGRVRDMVRRSGENIACAEVEQQIAAMPEVEEVGVIPVPDAARGEEVKAIIVMRHGAHLTAALVVDWSRQRLAPFKVPRYVEFRAELPHTASGKIHKAALRAEQPFNEHVVDLTAQPIQSRRRWPAGGQPVT